MLDAEHLGEARLDHLAVSPHGISVAASISEPSPCALAPGTAFRSAD
jgi:hypothetical protein